MWSLTAGLSRSAMSEQRTRRAAVRESPLANRVTSWPWRTSSSVRNETIRSVPPYRRGGQRSASGATCAIFIDNTSSTGEASTVGVSGGRSATKTAAWAALERRIDPRPRDDGCAHGPTIVVGHLAPPRHRLLDGREQDLAGEGLLDDGPLPVPRRHRPKHPGREIDEGHLGEREKIGDGQRGAPVDVEIEDGAIDVAALDHALDLAHRRRRTDHAIARLVQQALQVERHEGIVDDHQHPPLRPVEGGERGWREPQALWHGLGGHVLGGHGLGGHGLRGEAFSADWMPPVPRF